MSRLGKKYSHVDFSVDCLFCHFHRNPEHQYRPKFGEISSQLRAPATKLLYWSAQDSKLSEGAAVLGASLEEGYKLHEDLREKYKQYESI